MSDLLSKLCYDYSWQFVPDELAPVLFRDFADQGAENLSVVDAWCRRMIREKDFQEKLAGWARDAGLAFNSSHAPWGQTCDLNVSPASRRFFSAGLRSAGNRIRRSSSQKYVPSRSMPVSLRTAPPSYSQRFERYAFSSRSEVFTTNAARDPSGEKRAS